MSELRKYLWLSQISLFTGLFVCTLLMPSVAIRNGGVSNFGNHWLTSAPYALGFTFSALFMYLAALRVLNSGNLKLIARGLSLLAAFQIIVLLSTFPRRYGFTYSNIHDYIGVALFVTEFIISTWIVVKRPGPLSVALLGAGIFGSVIGLLSITKVIHLLFIGQWAGSLGFGLLLTIYLPGIVGDMAASQHLDL